MQPKVHEKISHGFEEGNIKADEVFKHQSISRVEDEAEAGQVGIHNRG